jgi:uncharacterized phage-associated protein
MNIGIQTNKELIGNLIILLAERCKPLYHTKMMKLLFLIDQEATLESGTPITWLEYKAWKNGPVSQDLYYSKNDGYNKFFNYVSFDKKEKNNSVLVKPVKSFDDSEFSEWDLDIINKVLSLYGQKTSDELIQLTHKQGSLWNKAVEKAGVKFSAKNQTSDEILDFLSLIENDGYKKTVYFSTLENLELKSTLK